MILNDCDLQKLYYNVFIILSGLIVFCEEGEPKINHIKCKKTKYTRAA